MANISTFLFIFTGILVVAGWISSEMISNKATRANTKSSQRAAKLEKENDQLTAAMSIEQEKYKTLKIEYEKAREAREQLKDFELEYKKVLKSYNRFSASLESLKEMVSAKKYSSNALSREVLTFINNSCPSADQMQAMKDDSTKEVFKRIKKRLSNTPE